MAAAAIRYAARRIGGRALQPTHVAVAVKDVQHSLLPRLFHSGKSVYSPRVSPFSNPASRRSSNPKVLATDKVKWVEYTINAGLFGLTHVVAIALFGYPGARNKIDPSPES